MLPRFDPYNAALMRKHNAVPSYESDQTVLPKWSVPWLIVQMHGYPLTTSLQCTDSISSPSIMYQDDYSFLNLSGVLCLCCFFVILPLPPPNTITHQPQMATKTFPPPTKTPNPPNPPAFQSTAPEMVVNPTKIPKRGVRDGLAEGGVYVGTKMKRDTRDMAMRPRDKDRQRVYSRGVRVS